MKLHAEAVHNLAGAELVGLWNRTREKGVIKAEKFGCKIYESVDALLNDPEIDAVFILTNMETHCEYTIKAAAAVLLKKAVRTIPKAATMIKMTKIGKPTRTVFKISAMTMAVLCSTGNLKNKVNES